MSRATTPPKPTPKPRGSGVRPRRWSYDPADRHPAAERIVPNPIDMADLIGLRHFPDDDDDRREI